MTTAGWAVRVRRGTYRIPWERSTTYALIQLALALVLIAPATESVIGRPLWGVTGCWHIGDMLGNILELGAMVSSALAGLLRMPAMRHRIVPLLWHPLVVGTAVLMMLFWQSRASHSSIADLYRVPSPHPWLNAYFAVFSTLLVYYGGLTAWVALSHLRGDPRAKPVALTMLVCVGLGAAAMLGWLLPWLHWTAWYDYGRIAMCAAVTAYAYTSARSWQRKLDPWRGIIKITRARL